MTKAEFLINIQQLADAMEKDGFQDWNKLFDTAQAITWSSETDSMINAAVDKYRSEALRPKAQKYRVQGED
ncbi:MAG: hypothetical protein AAF810_01285 [Cyanobacteria bacterium P01_D01_bin.36]